MKYAIISDIHGNYPALMAVLSDAREQGVHQYLLLGDYASGFTFCNEVTETVRGLENAVIIGGNHEGFLRTLQTSPGDFTDHSGLAPWCYHKLSPENLQFLLHLPETAVVKEPDTPIYLNHHLNPIQNIFFRWPHIIKRLHSVHFRSLFLQAPIAHEALLRFACEDVLSDPQRVEAIKALPEGIYLFGHNHIQFHMAYDGKLFINPGSCGEPLDGNPAAAYTILENGSVTERRVAYPISQTTEHLRQTDYYAGHAIWGDFRIKNIQTGLDSFRKFYAHVHETSRRLGESGNASGQALTEAFGTWRSDE